MILAPAFTYGQKQVPGGSNQTLFQRVTNISSPALSSEETVWVDGLAIRKVKRTEGITREGRPEASMLPGHLPAHSPVSCDQPWLLSLPFLRALAPALTAAPQPAMGYMDL